MNRAIILKTVRDTLPILLVVCAAIVLLETLFVCVLGQFSKEMEFILQNPIFQRFSRVLLGSQLGGATSSTSFLAFGFAHPLLFALTWAFILTNCTRVLAGEIERGTADLLLTLPVSRGGVFMSVSVVCVGAGIPVCIAPLVGAQQDLASGALDGHDAPIYHVAVPKSPLFMKGAGRTELRFSSRCPGSVEDSQRESEPHWDENRG